MEDRGLMTPDELAERWACSRQWLANMRCAGTGPTYVKLGRRVAYRVGDVLAYEDSAAVRSVTA